MIVKVEQRLPSKFASILLRESLDELYSVYFGSEHQSNYKLKMGRVGRPPNVTHMIKD